ncbi:MAG: hypothetical protein AABX01_03265 [Candidatus Micrarchaeota archaeon]
MEKKQSGKGRITKILVFGNPLVEIDSLPIKLMPDLEKAFPEIEFKEIDAADQVEDEGRDLVIIDAVFGIKRVEVITDLESIQLEKIYTMHDFDLGITLKLLKKIGKLDSALIFGVPLHYPKKRALKEVAEKIRLYM